MKLLLPQRQVRPVVRRFPPNPSRKSRRTTHQRRIRSTGLYNSALEPLVRQLAADFAAGKAAAFTIWVGEDESQRGNAVDLPLDVVPLGRFLIEQNRYALPSLKERGNRFDWRSSAQRVQTGEPFSELKRRRAKPRPGICTREEMTSGSWWSNDKATKLRTRFSAVILDGSIIESELVNTL